MAPALVQSAPEVNNNAISSLTSTFSTGATANNLLVILCAQHSSTVLLNAPSGWSIAKQSTISNSAATSVFYKIAAGGETSATVTSGSATDNWTQQMFEYSGVATSNVIDVTNVTSAGTSSSATGSATTTGSADLIIINIGTYDGVGLSSYGTPSGGFAKLGTNGAWLCSVDQRGVAAGTYSTSVSLTPSNAYTSIAVGFFAAAAVSSVVRTVSQAVMRSAVR